MLASDAMHAPTSFQTPTIGPNLVEAQDGALLPLLFPPSPRFEVHLLAAGATVKPDANGNLLERRRPRMKDPTGQWGLEVMITTMQLMTVWTDAFRRLHKGIFGLSGSPCSGV